MAKVNVRVRAAAGQPWNSEVCDTGGFARLPVVGELLFLTGRNLWFVVIRVDHVLPKPGTPTSPDSVVAEVWADEANGAPP